MAYRGFRRYLHAHWGLFDGPVALLPLRLLVRYVPQVFLLGNLFYQTYGSSILKYQSDEQAGDLETTDTSREEAEIREIGTEI